jgi:hypothetical protein
MLHYGKVQPLFIAFDKGSTKPHIQQALIRQGKRRGIWYEVKITQNKEGKDETIGNLKHGKGWKVGQDPHEG